MIVSDHDTVLCPYETVQKTNKRSYLLNFLTPAMVAINYVTVISAIVLIC